MPGRPRDPELERRLSAAAWSLLQSQGYDALKLTEVAARADAHRTDVYRRWSSKAQLVVDVLAEHLPQVSDPGTGSLRSDLLAIVEDFAASWSSSWIDGLMGLMADLHRDPDAELAFRKMAEGRGVPLRTAIAGGGARRARRTARAVPRCRSGRGAADAPPDAGPAAADAGVPRHARRGGPRGADRNRDGAVSGEPHELSAAAQLAALRAGDLSSRELTEHYLGRIEKLDGELGAFATVTPPRSPPGPRAASSRCRPAGATLRGRLSRLVRRARQPVRASARAGR